MNRELIEQLTEALIVAKQTIKCWHGDAAWPVYDATSPEMRLINRVINNGKQAIETMPEPDAHDWDYHIKCRGE